MSSNRSKIDPANKLPLQSKKFIAYLVADIGWKCAIGVLLFQLQAKFDHYSASLLLTLIVVSAFIQVGYILGEVALDRYTRMAERRLVVLDKEEIKKVARDMGTLDDSTDD
ncbi:MAG: hypothetical protein ACO32I_04625 [Candidatus Limnocylindrus sp.]